MQFRTFKFATSEIRVSEIGVGCGQLAPGASPDQAAAVHRAVELGVNLFDTADSYGQSEEALGELLDGVGRDRLVLATKFGTVRTPDGRHYQDHTAPHMAGRLEQSLRRLRTDYIDIYQVHTPKWPCIEDDELWAALDRLVEQGKIRGYGLSVDDREMAQAFLARTAGRTLQTKLNLLNQEMRPLLADWEARGIGVLVKVPMAGGSLTDRLSPDWPPPDDDRRQRWGEENFARRLRIVQAAREVLTADGRTTAQGALAWLLTLSPILVPIPGVSSAARLEETVGAAGRRLTPDQMQQLDGLEEGLLPTLTFGW